MGSRDLQTARVCNDLSHRESSKAVALPSCFGDGPG